MQLKTIKLLLFLLLCSSVSFAQKFSQESDTAHIKNRILVILDCSNSMWGTWKSDAKIKITQTVLNRFLDSVEKSHNTEIALRVFGHLNKGEYGTRLEVPFEKDNIPKIRSKIKTLVPKGNCTVASALSNAQNDFPACDKCRNIVIVITDGVDDCEGDICSVAFDIQKRGTIVQTFVIGIGEREDIDYHFNCAGKFFAVKDEDNFTSTLYSLENLSTQLASLQLRLLDIYGNPSETNVPVIFYDNHSGLVKYRYIHTLTQSSIPDTFSVDPLVSYDIEIGTLPPIFLKNLTFQSAKHNTLEVQAARGTLLITPMVKRSNLPPMSVQVIVRKSGEEPILNVQSLNEKQSYLVGKYDVEVLTTPKTELKDIEVKQSSVTQLEIPAYGLANVNKGKDICIGNVFVEKDKKLEWVCSFDESKAMEALYLLPGRYVGVIRAKNSNKTTDTMTKEFNVESGQTTNVVFGK